MIALRLAVIVLALVNLMIFPAALDVVNKPKRKWFLVFAVELLWLGMAIAVAYRLSATTIVWYRMPLLAAADVLGLIYIIMAFSGPRYRR